MHTGSCLCGAVRFEITGDLAPIQFCHCGVCRKAQGSAFASNIPVEAAAFHFVAGADRVKAFESSPGKLRSFCGDCGSPLFSQARAVPGVLRLRAGALDEPVATTGGFHFHVASKASWWPITDDLPRHDGARPV
jgi:hypothetical protein